MCRYCHAQLKAKLVGFGENQKPVFTFQKVVCECECKWGVEMSDPPRCPTCHHFIPIQIDNPVFTWDAPDLWLVDGKPVRRDRARRT